MTDDVGDGRWSRARRTTAAVSAVAVTQVLLAAPAMAQVSVSPSSDGMPGGPLAQRILGWLMQAALWASAGAVLYGGATWRGGTKSGNYGAASDGKDWVKGGLIGAALVGLAPTAINMLFNAGQAG
jgi:hypothetical protein